MLRMFCWRQCTRIAHCHRNMIRIIYGNSERCGDQQHFIPSTDREAHFHSSSFNEWAGLHQISHYTRFSAKHYVMCDSWHLSVECQWLFMVEPSHAKRRRWKIIRIIVTNRCHLYHKTKLCQRQQRHHAWTREMRYNVDVNTHHTCVIYVCSIRIFCSS